MSRGEVNLSERPLAPRNASGLLGRRFCDRKAGVY